MTNYIQPGMILTLTAPYTVTSGQGAKVDSIFGVAQTDVASGDEGEFATEGVFDLEKFDSIEFTQGEKVYWNATGRKCDESDSSGSFLIGVAVAAAAAEDTTVRVRLNGIALVS